MTSMLLAPLASEAATDTGSVLPPPSSTNTVSTTASSATTPTGQNDQGGIFSSGGLLLMVAVFAVLYLLLIHPQRKKEKDRQKQREAMLKNLAKNDHVMTIGGLHGIVASVTDTEVVLKVDEKSDTKMRFTREAISKVVTEDGKDIGGETLADKDKK
jgi:preprotein translocase subunit YajC